MKRSLLFALLVSLLGATPAVGQVWTTPIDICTANGTGGATTVTCSTAITAAAGDTVWFCAGTSTVTSVAVTFTSTGSDTVTLVSEQTTTNVTLQFGYVAVSAGGTYTPTANFATVANNRFIYVQVERATRTPSFVAGTDLGATGTSATPTTTAETVSGDANLLLVACGRSNGGGLWESHLINGVSPTTSGAAGTGQLWWTRNLSSLSSATAAATIMAGSTQWAITGAIFAALGARCQDLLLLGVGAACSE